MGGKENEMGFTNDKPVILRRLKTKDGIVSPIEEIREYRYRENRAVHEPMKIASWEATAILEADNGPEVRRYTMRRQTPAILIEMEEE